MMWTGRRWGPGLQSSARYCIRRQRSRELSLMVCFRESAPSLYTPVMLVSYITGERVTTSSPSRPAPLIPDLLQPSPRVSCLACRSDLKGIVLLPGWNIPVCAECLGVSCLVRSSQPRQRGSADAQVSPHWECAWATLASKFVERRKKHLLCLPSFWMNVTY